MYDTSLFPGGVDHESATKMIVEIIKKHGHGGSKGSKTQAAEKPAGEHVAVLRPKTPVPLGQGSPDAASATP